jgi:heme/copper-type cytochrome/quinol oxidase subunit 3
MTTATSPAPRDLALENATRVAVAAALSATTMLFASLVSAYVVRRSFADWQPASASWPAVLLGFAFAASAAIEIAARAEGGGKRFAILGLAVSTVLYLAGALIVIASTANGALGLRSPFDAFVVLLLGVHVFHALIGGAFAYRVLRRAGGPSPEALLMVRVVTHFLTALLFGVVFVLFGLR